MSLIFRSDLFSARSGLISKIQRPGFEQGPLNNSFANLVPAPPGHFDTVEEGVRGAGTESANGKMLDFIDFKGIADLKF